MASKQKNKLEGGAETCFPAIIELNVGGVFYSTSLNTLTSEPNSKLNQMFGQTNEGFECVVLKDSKVRPIFQNIFNTKYSLN